MRSLDTAVGDLSVPAHAPPEPDGPTEEELSRLSLVQALRDFEVANGRVIDLAERLLVTADELMKARRELDGLRAELDGLRAERDDLAARVAELSARHDALLDAHQKTLERTSVKLGERIWAARRWITSRPQDG